MLPRGRIDRFVEIHAADVYISVRVSDCCDDDVTLTRAIVAERRGQVGREFLVGRLALGSGRRVSKATYFKGSQDAVVPLGAEGAVPSRLDVASIWVVF